MSTLFLNNFLPEAASNSAQRTQRAQGHKDKDKDADKDKDKDKDAVNRSVFSLTARPTTGTCSQIATQK